MKRTDPTSPTVSLERDPVAHPGFRSGIYQAPRSAFDLAFQHEGREIHGAGITHKGRRKNNEDAIGFLVGKNARGRDLACFVLLDGMGGHLAGEVASRYAALTILNTIADPRNAHLKPKYLLAHSIQEASRALLVLSKVKAENHDMGTTAVALLLLGGEAHVGHAGDSRLYHFRDGDTLDFVTKDHPLTQALGPGGFATAEVRALGPIRAGARFLLSSDGLTSPADEIADIMGQNPPPKACEALVEHAIHQRHSTDNTSVILVEA